MVYYCGPVNTSYNGFFLATLKRLMKEWPLGSRIVINITQTVLGDTPHMKMGYNYNFWKVLVFVSNKGGWNY